MIDLQTAPETGPTTSPDKDHAMSVTDEPGVPELPVLTMAQPMPGFASLRRFALVRVDDSGLLCELRSVDDPDTSFMVVPPALFFPDYVVELGTETAGELGVETESDVLVLLVVTVGSDLASSTANLAAPVIVNVHTQRARQLVLDDAAYSLAAPLLSA